MRGDVYVICMSLQGFAWGIACCTIWSLNVLEPQTASAGVVSAYHRSLAQWFDKLLLLVWFF
jgi:hypothetical protein